ncbi:MAG: type II secretion system F family protein [Parasphingopyxis sp.]|nr:type II secretion system F family protein [Sphingomonadales bacterium]
MTLMPLLIFFAVAVSLTMVVFAFTGPSTSKAQAKRLAAMCDRYNSRLTAQTAEEKVRRILARQDSQLDSFAKRFIPRPEVLRQRLAQSGKSWTLAQYGIASVALGAVVFLLLTARGLPPLMALLVGIFAGFGIPHFVIGKMINRRIKKFNARFPDAIELLVRGLRSGLPISETLSVVASEVPDPVGPEFRNVVDKMKIGKTMDEALEEAAKRIATPEFKFFRITLAIQRETGGNLAETLSNLATVLRQRGQMKLKIRAMSSESKASAYIVGSLPFIVFGLIMMINPSYMGEFFVDERLIIAGMGGMVWMGIGVFIMAKMVNFEI